MSLEIEEIKVEGYERVVAGKNQAANLSAIISIHNTNLGPACGGLRLLPYTTQKEALNDVLRLSRGMSYKSALAGVGFGGGKSVIIGDPSAKTTELFEAFGEFVDTLNGRYITAKDMNITSEDLLRVKTKTKHVLGIEGVEGSSGDPSPVTARGIIRALEATVEAFRGSRELKGLKVAIEGLGTVGMDLAKMILGAGGTVWGCDLNPDTAQRAKQLGVQVVPAEGIYELECDVFSPCAVGATINGTTVEQLRCRAVVGCANNQLATPADGNRLHERGILYAPDYAANSGGIINVYQEFVGYDQQKALERADSIYDTMHEVYVRASKQGHAPFVIADQLAEERLYGKRHGGADRHREAIACAPGSTLSF